MNLPDLDPLVHQRTRLQLLTLLNRNREVPLAWAKRQLGLTYGNLHGHAAKLEEAGYLKRRRALTPDGFQVRLAITRAGHAAFRGYLEALQTYLQHGATPLCEKDDPEGQAASLPD